MEPQPTPRATLRSNWYAELSAALHDGERVLASLIAARINPVETERLQLRLIELRSELDRLNRVDRAEGRGVCPAWRDGTGAMAETRRALHPDWLARRD